MTATVNANTTTGVVVTSDTSGALALQTGGTTAMTISSAQLVGIGTSSPASKLEVNGATSIFGAAGTAAGLTALTVGDATNATFRMAFTNGTVIQLATNSTVSLAFGSKETSAGTFTERVRIPAAGGFQSVGSISVGNATPSASGAGITFPADQTILGASSNANTLDDYEEGTFTPTILFGGNNTGMVMNREYGRYTKIGNRVLINIYASISPTKGVATGNATIGGLPFQNINLASSGAQTGCVFNNPQVLYTGSPQAYVENNAVHIQLATVTEAGFASGMSDTNFQNNSVVQIMCHYETS